MDKELLPINKNKTFTFNVYEETGLNEDVRLVVYDEEKDSFFLFREIKPREKMEVDFNVLDHHMNYKYKYQTKEKNKWQDATKYKRLLPEAVTEEGIKYLFYPAEESDKLVVIFQAINKKQSYNYIKTLRNTSINRLYIKDEYGGDPATRSSYYLGKEKNMDVFFATQKLIQKTSQSLGISRADTIFAGSSKGGFAALYHGYYYGAGYILAGGPQILLGDYLGQTNEDSVRPPIFHSIVGEVNEENKEWANQLMYNALQNAERPYPKTTIHIGKGDPHYKEHVLPFMEWAEKLNIENVELDIENYGSHDELAIYYPIFLKERINQLLNKMDRN